MTEEKEKTKEEQKSKIWRAILIVALVILAWFGGYIWSRNTVSPIEKTKNVEKMIDITFDWETFKSEEYGFSFKHPREWEVKSARNISSGVYEIAKSDSNSEDERILISISGERGISTKDSVYAIQTSIPFDKKNYLIFSTSTENEEKKIFYNILATLEFGVK